MIGLIAGFGGFNKRSDWRVDIDPGTVVDINAAQISIGDAIGLQFSDGHSWYLMIQAQINNLSDQTLTSNSLINSVVLRYRDDAGQVVVLDSLMMQIDTTVIGQINNLVSFLTGDSTTMPSGPRQVIPPHCPDMSVVFTTYLTDGIDMDDPPLVGLIPVTYQYNGVLGLSTQANWDEEPGVDHYWMVKPDWQTIPL